VIFNVGVGDDDWRDCEVVGLALDDNEEEREAERGVDEPWEESEGIAIRTATLMVGGELELSSVIEIFAEFEREFVSL